jgi:predicted HTH domain antitoxin
MSERVINISFPVKENILLSLKESKDEFAKEILFFAALVHYRKRKLSLGKAAELAGCNKIEFIEKLQGEEEFIFDYTDEEIDEIYEDAEKIK